MFLAENRGIGARTWTDSAFSASLGQTGSGSLPYAPVGHLSSSILLRQYHGIATAPFRGTPKCSLEQCRGKLPHPSGLCFSTQPAWREPRSGRISHFPLFLCQNGTPDCSSRASYPGSLTTPGPYPPAYCHGSTIALPLYCSHGDRSPWERYNGSAVVLPRRRYAGQVHGGGAERGVQGVLGTKPRATSGGISPASSPLLKCSRRAAECVPSRKPLGHHGLYGL